MRPTSRGTVVETTARLVTARCWGPTVRPITAPAPYLHLPGTAREALAFYRDVFGGEVEVHTLADFGRTDGPPDAVARSCAAR